MKFAPDFFELQDAPHFFALRDDLLPIFEAAERVCEVKYVCMGMFETDTYETFDHGRDIPDLGVARAESAVRCDSYLVTMRATPINVEPVKTIYGRRYRIDQLFNRQSIEFSPGGLWRGDILLYGRVATAHAYPVSLELLRAFGLPVVTQFRKIRGYYVGPRAFDMLKAGRRLTLAEQTPREYDLKMPD